MRGGADLRPFRVGLAVGALLLAVTVSRADGVDPRAGVGTSGGGSPSCATFLFSVDGTGAIPAGTDCLETSNTYSIEVFSPGTNPLSVYSPLLDSPTADTPFPAVNATADALLASLNLKWSESCAPTTVAGAPAWECTLTAPTLPSIFTPQWLYDVGVLKTLNALGVTNDGDCDEDDDILFIPAGCDVNFTTGSLGTSPDLQGDTPDELFEAYETLGVTNGTPLVSFPEPGSLGLLAIGLAGVGLIRRRFSGLHKVA